MSEQQTNPPGTATAQAHLHRCQGCGSIWGHGNMMEGDIAAHKCPKCGKQEWRVYQGGGRPQGQGRGQVKSIAQPWYVQAAEIFLLIGALAGAGYCVLMFVRELQAK